MSKESQRKASLKYYNSHKEQRIARNKTYKRTPKARFNSAKRNSKSRKLDFTITFEEFCHIIKFECGYCRGFFPKSQTGVGLDRLDNNEGYHIGNVISCCGTCNSIRNNLLTPEETWVAVQAIIRYKGDNTWQVLK
jgi:hypothetical protein